MTGLLVSVRSLSEAQTALLAGVDLLDVKEPLRGALGAAEPRVIAEIAGLVAGRIPSSAAWGELSEAAGVVPDCGLTYLKVGLAGESGRHDWPARWRQAADRLEGNCELVAVAYADAERAGSPPPLDVLYETWRRGARTILVDTFDKSAGGLFSHWPLAALGDWLARARALGMQTAVAGSLTVQDLGWIVPLEPDYVAVRGAACRQSRTGGICGERIAAIKEALAAERRGRAGESKALALDLPDRAARPRVDPHRAGTGPAVERHFRWGSED
jgi:uncharacterized protein (UPF0264 family)